MIYLHNELFMSSQRCARKHRLTKKMPLCCGVLINSGDMIARKQSNGGSKIAISNFFRLNSVMHNLCSHTRGDPELFCTNTLKCRSEITTDYCFENRVFNLQIRTLRLMLCVAIATYQ